MDLLTRVVAAFEAFSPRVYPDAVGRPTVGMGHLIQPGEDYSQGITREQGLALLARDLQTARHAVDVLFRDVYLAPHELDALTSFAFNAGGAALRESTLRQHILGGRAPAAAYEFLRWVHATRPDGTKVTLAGLIRRRDLESIWFLGAHPSTVARLAGIPAEEE